MNILKKHKIMITCLLVGTAGVIVLGGCVTSKNGTSPRPIANRDIKNSGIIPSSAIQLGQNDGEDLKQITGVNHETESIGEYLDAIPNDSLRWVGVRNGMTIAIDIFGNEEILDQAIDSVPFLPSRSTQKLIDLGKKNLTPAIVSPYDNKIAVGIAEGASLQAIRINLESGHTDEFIFSLQELNAPLMFVPIEWISSDELLVGYIVNDITNEDQAYLSGLIQINLTSLSYHFIASHGFLFSETGITMVTPNGKMLIYQEVAHPREEKDNTFYFFDSGKRQPIPEWNFDPDKPSGITSTELLSLKRPANAGISFGSYHPQSLDGVCNPSNVQCGDSIEFPVFSFPWECGKAFALTRDGEGCTISSCGLLPANALGIEKWFDYSNHLDPHENRPALDFSDTYLEYEKLTDDIPVLAAASGSIYAYGTGSGTAGQRAWIKHTIGSTVTYSAYFHFDSYFGGWTEGAQVLRGDTLGHEGKSGCDIGPDPCTQHIHFETRTNPSTTSTAFWPRFIQLSQSEIAQQNDVYVSQNLKGSTGAHCNRFPGIIPQVLACGDVLMNQSTANGSMAVSTYYSEPTDFGGLSSPQNGSTPGQAGPARNCSGPEKIYRLPNTTPYSGYKITVSDYGLSNLQVYALKGASLMQLDPMKDCVGVSCNNNTNHPDCFPGVNSGESVVWIDPMDNYNGGDIFIVVDGKDLTGSSFKIEVDCMQCIDIFEPNNSINSYYTVSNLIGAYPNSLKFSNCLNLQNLDEDWFLIPWNSNYGGRVDIGLHAQESDFNLELRGLGGGLLASSVNGSTMSEILSFCYNSMQCSGTYIRIFPQPGIIPTGEKYDLVLTWHPNQTCSPNNLAIGGGNGTPSPDGVTSAVVSPSLICPGEPVTISMTGATQYIISGPNGNSICSPCVGSSQIVYPPTTPGIHSYTISDYFDPCGSKVTVAVTVVDAPVAEAGPDQPSPGSGSPITIQGSNSGGPATAIVWLPNGTPNTTTPTVSPTTTTTYTMHMTNGTCTSTDAMTITVPSSQLALIPSKLNVCVNEPVTFTALNGTPPYTFIGGNLNTTTISNTATDYPSTASPKIYSVTDGNGNSSIIAIVVHERPLAVPGPDQNVNPGQSTYLVGNATGGTPPYSFLWTSSSGGSWNVSSPLVSPSAFTTYSLTVSDLHGCASVNSASMWIDILTPPQKANLSFVQGGTNAISQSGKFINSTVTVVNDGQVVTTVNPGVDVMIQEIGGWGLGQVISANVPIGFPTNQPTTFSGQLDTEYFLPGEYFVTAILDEYDYEDETNEGDNIYPFFQTFSLYPDLTIGNPIFSSAVVQAGNSVDLTFDAINQGHVRASSSFFVRSYLSSDTILDAGDIEVGSLQLSNLLVSTSQSGITLTSTVPGTASNGLNFLFVVIDADDSHPELIEENNVIIQPIFVNSISFPIQWLSISAEPLGSMEVSIKASAIFDENQKEIVLERSQGDTVWSEVSQKLIFPSPGEEYSFAFIDNTPSEGSSAFYRCKAIDIDGNITFSNIAEAQWSNSLESFLNVFPNPADKELTIQFLLVEGTSYSLEVYNSLGQLTVPPIAAVHEPGVQKIKLNIRNWSRGTYYVVLMSEVGVYSRRLVIN